MQGSKMGKRKQKAKRDWASYNAHLVSRGYLTIFVSKDFADNWTIKYDENTPRQRGGQAKYTDEAITALLSLRFVFRQPLRSMEGFAKSLMSMMKLDLEVPDYSTLSLKIKTMNIKLPPVSKDRIGHVASLDSTGLKIHGQGEWNRKKHKQTDRREWVKMHLAVDNESMQILSVESTADDVHDCEVFDQLVDALPEQIDKALADGAYDTLQAYKKSMSKGIDLVALPRDNAVVDVKATEAHVLRRNEHIERYQNKGIYAWANKNKYWDRNRAETMMSRFKTTFSGTLASRKVESQKNEIMLKCKILNILASNIVPLQESVV
jgi:IS5 family transposase